MDVTMGGDVSEVLYVQVVTAPDGGGAERVARELGRQLHERGFDSRVLYFRNPRGVPLHKWEAVVGQRKPRNPVNGVAIRRAIKSLEARGREVIVHAHLTWSLYFCATLGRMKGVRLVYTEHSTHNKRRAYRLLRPLECWIYNQYEFIGCITDATRRNLVHWLGANAPIDRIATIHNGSRLFRRVPRRSVGKGTLRVLSIGSLTPKKGFDVALRAVARLQGRVQSYTIVGDGPERDRLERLAESLSIGTIVSMPGYVNCIEQMLHETDIGLIPSRWEGFGLVGTEMLSTGLPIVASRVEGMEEILSGCPGVRLVAADNVDALMDGICQVADESVGNESVSKQASVHAAQFSWEAMVDQYVEVYDRILRTNKVQC